jgi:hypothetical protein
MGGSCGTHGGDEMCTQFWSEDPGVDGRIILEWILEKRVARVWTGFVWFRIGASEGPL